MVEIVRENSSGRFARTQPFVVRRCLCSLLGEYLFNELRTGHMAFVSCIPPAFCLRITSLHLNRLTYNVSTDTPNVPLCGRMLRHPWCDQIRDQSQTSRVIASTRRGCGIVPLWNLLERLVLSPWTPLAGECGAQRQGLVTAT